MRRLILLALFFCLPAHAATFVQAMSSAVAVGDHWNSSTASPALDLPAPATAGNGIACAVRISDGGGGATITGIDDAGTTVYALAKRQADAAVTGNTIEIWWGIAAGANAGTDIVATANATAPSTDNFILCAEFSGIDSTQGTIQTDGDVTNGTSHTTGPVTPGAADNVLIAASSGSSREWTTDADFTGLLDNGRSLVSYKIQTANTAQSFTVTSDLTADTAMALAALKGTASGGSSSIPAIYRHLRQMKQ